MPFNLLILPWGNGASTLIKSAGIERLFHHLRLPTLLDHVPIVLIASLLLLVRRGLPYRSRRPVGRSGSNFLAHVLRNTRVCSDRWLRVGELCGLIIWILPL